MLLLLALSGTSVDLSALIKREVARQECRDGRGSDDEVVVCSNRRDRQRYRLART